MGVTIEDNLILNSISLKMPSQIGNGEEINLKVTTNKVPLSKEMQAKIQKQNKIKAEQQIQGAQAEIKHQQQEEQARIEQQKQEELKQKAEEAEKLRQFLLERKTTVYNYKELQSEDYDRFKNKSEQQFNDILHRPEYQNTNYSAQIIFNIDTNGIVTYKINNLKSNNPDLENKVQEIIKNVKLNTVTKNNYSVFSSFEYSLELENYTEGFSFSKVSDDLILKKGDASKFVEIKRFKF
jgi:hypothetical protein